MSVIGAARRDRRCCHRRGGTGPPPSARPGPRGGRVGPAPPTSAGPCSGDGFVGTRRGWPRSTGDDRGGRSMVRPSAVPTTRPDAEDRSMRVIEYALAFVAAAVAGVLAFLR